MSDQDWRDCGWLPAGAWAACVEPNPDALYSDVPVVDEDLGAIAVARLPDGREAYGADGGDLAL